MLRPLQCYALCSFMPLVVLHPLQCYAPCSVTPLKYEWYCSEATEAYHSCSKSWHALVSLVSRNFLYFRWEEQEGEKNTSGRSGQFPVPRSNVIIAFMAACHVHGMQIKKFIMLGVIVLCSFCPHWQAVATESAFRTIPLVHVERKSRLESGRSL